MIIHLKKSTLFTVDPDLRFARENGVPIGLWSDMYRRYELFGYTFADLRDYYEFKVGRKQHTKFFKRWVWRTEIYNKVQPLLTDGAEMIVSSYFEHDEMYVIKEITKNLRASVHKETKTLP